MLASLSFLLLAAPLCITASPLTTPGYLYLPIKAVEATNAPITSLQKRQAALGLRNYLNGTAYSVKCKFSSSSN
jgi:hypothetical protein